MGYSHCSLLRKQSLNKHFLLESKDSRCEVFIQILSFSLSRNGKIGGQSDLKPDCPPILLLKVSEEIEIKGKATRT